MRQLDEDYYEQAYLSYEIRIGNLIQPNPKHDDPADYGLTREQGIKMRLRYLRQQRRELELEYGEIKTEFLLGRRPYAMIALNDLQEQIDKLTKDIKFNCYRLRTGEDGRSYDLERLKQIPLDRITKINSNGFFQDNPFRKEKSPSNSLHWDKRKNRYYDFTTGNHGSSIDLYMAINRCDFKTACKEMENL